MKNTFTKLLAVSGLLAIVSYLMVACTPDMVNLPPHFEVTGEPIVHNAVSVDIPVKAQSLNKIACWVREYAIDENGDARIVTSRDDEGNLSFGDLITKLPRPQQIVNKGKLYECYTSLSALHLSGNEGLDRNMKFVYYIVATMSAQGYWPGNNLTDYEIYTGTFETPDKYADDDVAVIRESGEGMDVYVTFPPSVKKAGRRVKWGVTNIAMLEYNGNPSMPEMLHNNEHFYPAYLFTQDTLLEINHHNAYRRNAVGEVGYYMTDGYRPDGSVIVKEVPADDPNVKTGAAAPVQYYYLFQPGEPLVLLLSEVGYTDCEEYFKVEYPQDHLDTGCDKKHPTVDYGWGPGWFWYPYDFAGYVNAIQGDDYLPMPGVGGNTSNVDPDKFWHEGAWYRKIELRLPGPSQYTKGSVEITVPEKTPDSATIKFKPTGDTFAYLWAIFKETDDYGEGYRDVTTKFLDGDETLWQWFSTSEIGSYFGFRHNLASEGEVEVKLEEYFYNLSAKDHIHIICTAVGGHEDDEDSYTFDILEQDYHHVEFKLPDYTLPAPVLEITPVEPYSPFKVGYILKNVNYASNPVKKVVYTANYTREFDSYMSQYGATITDMVEMNKDYASNQLSADNLRKVNSAEGYLMEFDVYEDTSFKCAIMGWNMEGRPSDPEAKNAKAWAEATSTKLEPATPLDMTELNKLKGVWTATAYVKSADAEDDSTTDDSTELASEGEGEGALKGAKLRSWKVEIGDLTSPEALSQENYDLLAKHGVSKEVADEHFKKFKEQEKAYNEAVLGQNRVTCQGWAVDDKRIISKASPWDLFLMDDYNASETRYLFHDFGAKWFLQTNADGKIFIPVNYNRVQPLTCWYTGMSHYLAAANVEEGYAVLIDNANPESVESRALPVTISEDGNKLTIGTYDITYIKTDQNGNYVQDTDEDGNLKVDEDGNPIWAIDKTVTYYPNVLYDYYGAPAFYQTYIVSEVVLTRGWTEPEPEPEPEPAPGEGTDTPATFSKRGVKMANISGYKTPSKPLPHSVFVPRAVNKETKVTKFTGKQLSKQEIREGLDKYSNKNKPAMYRK